MDTFICAISDHFHNKENRAPLQERKNDETGEVEMSNKWAMSYSFVARKNTPKSFIQHVLTGGAFAIGQYSTSARAKKFFQAGYLLAMDIDNTIMVKRTDPITGEFCRNEAGKIIKDKLKRVDGYVTYQDIVNTDFVQRYAMLVYPSPSCTEDWHKVRVVFRLSETVLEAGRWETLQLGMLNEFKHWHPDGSCSDSARLYFGSTNRVFEPYINLETLLPLSAYAVGR